MGFNLGFKGLKIDIFILKHFYHNYKVVRINVPIENLMHGTASCDKLLKESS